MNNRKDFLNKLADLMEEYGAVIEFEQDDIWEAVVITFEHGDDASITGNFFNESLLRKAAERLRGKG